MQLPILTGTRVVLRPLADADLDGLLEMVKHESVRDWWGTPEPDEDRRQGFLYDGKAFAIEVGGELAGWLGFEEEPEPDWKYASLDILLGPAAQGRGLGPEALRLVIRWLIDEHGHHRFTIDPAVANARAIRAYERVGFKPVGVMRQYERDRAGNLRDALLMDLIADEFVR